jgi:hypothetical protein
MRHAITVPHHDPCPSFHSKKSHLVEFVLALASKSAKPVKAAVFEEGIRPCQVH